MRTSMVSAAFLLVGAGAVTVAAGPGDNIALNGSDTLFDVTQQVMTSCGAQFPDPTTGFNTRGITYKGGGSGVGAGQMDLGAQHVSPMSRALKNSEYCSFSGAAATGGASPGLAEDLLVGIDGVAIVADQTNSCSSSAANGFGTSVAFAVTNDGTATGAAPSSCPGCDASNNYTFADSFDALKVLYFGLTHDNTYDCASPVRKSLIKNWRNLFTTDCGAGDATCSAGLTHAWRRSDLSGTTDAFVSVLNPPSKSGTSVGIGTLSTVPTGASQKMNPFCNSADANASPPVVSFGGSSDYSDKDPIRTQCGASNGNEDACGPGPASAVFRGDLGVVLPVLIPDATTTTAADLYHSQSCSTSCGLVAPYRGSLAGQYPGFRCPDGTLPLAGLCFVPVTASGDARCKAAATTKCVSASGRPDGRQYNLINIVAASQIPSARRGTATYQMATDAFNRIQTGAFYRIHETTLNPKAVPDATVGTTGTCRENDDTSQIGCLTNADPCSVGYAGREAAKFYPGLSGTPQPASLKALAVNGTPPFTPGADPDLALENLLQPPGTTPFYPLARRLYFATVYGFGNLQGGESMLAQCYGSNSIVGPAISAHGFVQIPGGVQCLDFPEDGATTSTPAPNVQGAGNVGFGGCGLGLSNQNACAVSPPTITP